METINKVLTFAEAEQKYGLAAGTLRKYLYQTDKEKQRINENIDYRKSGKTWLITKEAMDKIYGKKNIE